MNRFMDDQTKMTDEDWEKKLTPEQFNVLRKKGTEKAFSGALLDNHDSGMYVCAACGTPVFSSDAKFDSGTGWPSFTATTGDDMVETEEDRSFFMRRTEVHCKKCGGHLGHVFDDGPREAGGKRYCINSCSLDFKKGESDSEAQA